MSFVQFVRTRNHFLRGMCLVYLFAFLSLYIQIPGLNGQNGILPANSQMKSNARDIKNQILEKPTLLWLAPYIGLNTEYTMDLFALIGSVLSLFGVVSQRFCRAPVFALLWALYLSLFQVNTVFLGFQWDTLLLEAGFLCIFIAPIFSIKKASVTDEITLWSARWLLFRLMFASGIVKLTSKCPTWWGLTALDIHFESQCIPTPLAWYAHHLPRIILRISVLATYMIEIIVPFLFLLPIYSVRVFAFYFQLLLQIGIVLTGNYTFFNLLTVVLCFSLLNDSNYYDKFKRAFIPQYIFSVFVNGSLVYISLYFIEYKPETGEIKLNITDKDLNNYLIWLVPATMAYGIISLCLVVAKNLGITLLNSSGVFEKFKNVVKIVIYSGVILFITILSMVPYSSILPSQAKEPVVLTAMKPTYIATYNLHLTSSYGLFRRMTGVDGRLEVIIEGSNDLNGPWKEYNFRYKPGNVNSSLKFVAPHQPRLDWQMWFASLSTYHHNPWIVSLAYRLLQGEQKVLRLLDINNNPFRGQPPRYVRATLYRYHFTDWDKRSSSEWWTRERVGEYFPIYSRDHKPLLDYLKQQNIISTTDWPNKNLQLKNILDHIRILTIDVDPFVLVLTVFAFALSSKFIFS